MIIYQIKNKRNCFLFLMKITLYNHIVIEHIIDGTGTCGIQSSESLIIGSCSHLGLIVARFQSP